MATKIEKEISECMTVLNKEFGTKLLVQLDYDKGNLYIKTGYSDLAIITNLCYCIELSIDKKLLQFLRIQIKRLIDKEKTVLPIGPKDIHRRPKKSLYIN